MKETKISRISTQNNELLASAYKETYDKVQDYLDSTPDVLEDNSTISVSTLLEILKDYYSPLSNVMEIDSKYNKELIDNINVYLNGPKKVIGIRKSKNSSNVINELLSKITTKGEPKSGKYYTNVSYFIREDSTGAILEFMEDGKHKKLVVCRHKTNYDLFYGQMSEVDNEVVDYIADDLVRVFDLIDGYRDSLPEQIDTDIALDDFACKPYEYAKFSVPFTSPMVRGEVFVNSNGYVDADIHLTKENNPYAYTRIDEYQKNIRNLVEEVGSEMLDKIPIDVDSLDEPIRGIVVSELAMLDKITLP